MWYIYIYIIDYPLAIPFINNVTRQVSPLRLWRNMNEGQGTNCLVQNEIIIKEMLNEVQPIGGIIWSLSTYDEL